jgi:large subunit ribosomal protein L28
MIICEKVKTLEKQMARHCDLTGKKANNAFAISHSHRRTKRLQEANLQTKRVWWPQGKRFVKLRLSTKAIKTLEKKGISAMAREAGIDLSKY